MPISLPLVNRMLADGNLTISVFFCRVAEACHHRKHFDYYQIGQSVLLKADQTLCSFFLFVRVILGALANILGRVFTGAMFFLYIYIYVYIY